MTHLLIVDQDVTFCNTMQRALRSQGHRATLIENPDALASVLAIQRPDVVLLDLNPGAELDGIAICQRLRTWTAVPVFMISTGGDERTKVRALDAGADDYLVKPFGVDELLARVRAVQRRLAPRTENGTLLLHRSPLIQIRDLTIDLDGHTVLLRDKLLHLTRKEFSLLRVLALAGGRLVTYEKLMQEVWGRPAHAVERVAVRTLIKQLRHKLGDDPDDPVYLMNESGIGYRLRMDSR